MEPVDAARDLVQGRFPEALAAFLGGTVLSSLRTPTSDLDIVVVRPDGAPAFRETVRHLGWIAELFVCTPIVYEEIVADEMAARRSPLLHMVGHGTIVADVDGLAARLQVEAARRLAEGPPPATPEQIENMRYGLSDLLDDLTGARDGDELAFVAIRLFQSTAELGITLRGGWLGTGKWLGRQLGAVDPELRQALLAALRAAVVGDRTRLVEVASAVLDRAGGRCMEGYIRIR